MSYYKVFDVIILYIWFWLNTQNLLFCENDKNVYEIYPSLINILLILADFKKNIENQQNVLPNFFSNVGIRAHRSRNFTSILFELKNYPFLKKKNWRDRILQLTNWITFCAKHSQNFLGKVHILMEWSWKPKTTNFYY